jgi:hypothetical protein
MKKSGKANKAMKGRMTDPNAMSNPVATAKVRSILKPRK